MNLVLRQRHAPLHGSLYRFWHHWCVHASAYNGSDKVRQAVIARFHSTLPGFPLLWDDGGVGPFDPRSQFPLALIGVHTSV